MRELKVVINGCHRIATLMLFLLVFGVASAQQFTLPCKKYPASVPFKCDAAVDNYWHVTSVKCLGPANGGYKFRISGRANKSHRRESIDLLYIRGANSVSMAGAYFFPTIEEGKIFSFDVVSAFKGRSPSRFNGFLIISRPLQEAFHRELEAEQEADEPEADAGVEVIKEHTVIPVPQPVDISDSNIYTQVEENPSFPGGQAAMFEWMGNNMKYPIICEENGVQGRVIVTFVVEHDGSISNVQVVKSVDPSLDKESVRLVKAMPRWIPGKQKGKPVRVKFTVPVTFRLK